MNLSKMKLLFWLRRNARNPDSGKAPIILRITVNGVRVVEKSTALYITAADWNAKKQQAREAEINARLKQISSQVWVIFLQMAGEGKHLRAVDIEAIFRPASYFQVAQTAQKFLKRKESQPLANSTRQQINIMTRHFVDFFGAESSLEDITQARARSWITHMQEKGTGPGNINNHLGNAAGIWEYAQLAGRNPFKGLRLKTPRKSIVFLSKEQLHALEKNTAKTATIDRCRRLFLLQCYTGLCFSDLMNLTPEQIFREKGKITWLRVARKKTSTPARIPLAKKSLQILAALHFFHTGKIPVISNHRYNKHLKEIALQIGFSGNLTSHVGRKTAGMLLLDAGVSIEVVSRVLGHSGVAITERYYAHVLETRILREFRENGLLSDSVRG